MRKLTSLLILSLLLVSVNPVFADNDNSSGNSVRNNIKTKVEQKIQEREAKLEQIKDNLREKLMQKTATREAKLNILRQNLIKKYYSNMSKRLWATIDRLDTIASRIDARIVVLESTSGKDLTSVKNEVTSAKSILSDTRSLLTSSDGMIDEVISSNSPKDAFSILKTNLTDIKNNLKEVHRILVKVIGEIEGLHVGNTKVTPTLTIAPSTTP